MTWILILILTTGGRVSAPQKDHESCLRGLAQASLQSEVKVAYCSKQPPRGHEDRSTWMKQLCVTMDDETLQAIDKAAKRDGQNRSAWVRDQLTWALQDRDAR